MHVAVAGRRIDPLHSEVKQFPLDQIEIVRQRMQRYIERIATHVYSSAACGTDLLALEIARVLGLPFTVILPFESQIFKEHSVIDRPGDWERTFENLIHLADSQNRLIQLHESSDNEEAFGIANARILGEAASAGGKEFATAIVVWERTPAPSSDWTAHFVNSATKLGLTIIDIPSV